MSSDYLGNPLTTGNDAIRQGIDDFVGGMLGYEQRVGNVMKVADENPGHCLANAYSAILHLFLESPEGPPKALPYLERAESAAKSATRREQMNVAAVRAWYDDDMPKAIAIGNEIADEFPRDLPMVKLAQTHNFNLGNAAGMLSIAHKVHGDCDDVCHMHGIEAFAYEQCHLLDEAEKSAWRAIEMQRKEPWAHHALAHVMITRGEINQGVDFLTGVSDTWNDLSSFMFTHNWWHLALNHISLGQFDAALALYDDKVWGVWKEYSQDQVNAISLLLRLELAGADVGNRWQDVGEYISVRVNDFIQPFLTMHYIAALARTDAAKADELLDNMRNFAAIAPQYSRKTWQEVALPACEAIADHARGSHGEVVVKLGPANARLQEIGGSHAQRDLFDQILLDSTLKTGNFATAQQMLEMRRGYEPDSVPNNQMLVMVYDKLGLPQEAAKANARVAMVLGG